jgi:hypothetical protein
MSNYTCWSMEVSTVHKSQILLCRKVCKSGWVLLNIGAIKGAGWKAGRPSIHPPAAWSSAATWPNPGRAAHDLGDVAARLCGLNPRDAAETFSGTDAGLSNSSLAHSAGLVNDPSVARWTLVLSAIQLGGHAWGWIQQTNPHRSTKRSKRYVMTDPTWFACAVPGMVD